jgi:hypothetical protein
MGQLDSTCRAPPRAFLLGYRAHNRRHATAAVGRARDSRCRSRPRSRPRCPAHRRLLCCGARPRRRGDTLRPHCSAPSPAADPCPRAPADFTRGGIPRDVALQVAFERQILKPVFSLDRL